MTHLLDLYTRPKKVVSIDIETTGLSYKDRVLTIALACREIGCTPSVPVFKDRPGSKVQEEEGLITSQTVLNLGKHDLFNETDGIPTARSIISKYLDGADWVVCHGTTFDIPYLMKLSLVDPLELDDKLFDTLAMARATASHESVSLANLVTEYRIDVPTWLGDMKSKRGNLINVGTEQLLAYNGEDARINLDLFEHIYGLASQQYSRQFLLDESRYSAIISRMRYYGIPINMDKLRSHRTRMREELVKHLRTLVKMGIRSHSDNFVAKYILSSGYHLPKTDKGNPKVDEPSLLSLPVVRKYREIEGAEAESFNKEHHRIPEFVNTILRIRTLEKALSTWVSGFEEEMDDNNKVHPLWSVAGTVSYRLTCTEPGAQAVPEYMRCWEAEDGYAYLEADYSQAELRYGAAIAGEDTMAEAFEAGEDIHYTTSKAMYGAAEAKAKRKVGKVANFTGFYGGGAPAMSDALNISLEEASTVIQKWRDGYKNVWSTSKAAEKVWKQRGYLVLAHGKRLWASPDDIKYRIYKAFNQLVQGSIAEIIKRAMLDIDSELPDVKQVGQVHDNLMTQLPKERKEEYREKITEIMMNAAPAHILNMTCPPISMEVDSKIVDVK